MPAPRPARAAPRSCFRWCGSQASAAGLTSMNGAPGSSRSAPRRPPDTPWWRRARREPLILEEPLPEDDTARADGQPYVLSEPQQPPPAGEGPGPHPSGRLLIVAGDGTPDPRGLACFAARAGIPLLADPLSGARGGEAAIAHYDLLLRDPAFAAAHRPQFVFRLGDLPTSKPPR